MRELYSKFKAIAIVCLCFLSFQSLAGIPYMKNRYLSQISVKQNLNDTIKGVVRDNNGKPLKGVLVITSIKQNYYITKVDGKFAILTDDLTLTFYHPDFNFRKVTVSNKAIEVQLAARFLPMYGPAPVNDTLLISESKKYIEVLHGLQSTDNILQSISTIGNSQLTTTPSSQFLQALPGRISGLNIGFNSGAPGFDGTGLSYNVRSARGANIVLIDGVQRPFLSIDPQEIESVSVLKDALATVMYGMRSSNGIISITTKKGSSGTPRISFTAESAIQRPTALPKPLNAGQFATLYNEAQQNDAGTVSITPRYSAADIAAYNNHTDPYGHPDVNWYKTVLNNQSIQRHYNFNVQGSGSNFRYFVDLDNFKETGLLKTIDSNVYNTNAQLDRYIIRTNLGVDVTSTTFMQLNLFGRIGSNNQPGGGVANIFNSLANTPQNAYPVFNPNGSLATNSTFGSNANIYGQAVQRGYQFLSEGDIAVDLQATQKLDIITPGLYLKAQGSYNNSALYTTVRDKSFASYQLISGNNYNLYGSTTAQGSSGSANARSRVTYAEADLGYARSFGKNNVSGILVANQQSTMVYDTGNLPELYTDYAGRFTYDYDGKYLAEVAGSYAGYNYFAPAKRWAPYWAAGLGWNMHQEKFIKDNFEWISKLKIRGTYGHTGQANTGYYSYIQTYFTRENDFWDGDAYWFGQSASLIRGSGENALVNQQLGPEKAKKINIGADLGFFNNKLTITGEYFKNRFYDLVATPGSQTALLGAAFPSKNLQIFDYWGTEFTLNWQDHVGNLNYFLSGNLSTVQSKIIFNDELPHANAYQYITGRPVGMLYGYTATGLFQSYGEINDPKTTVLSSTPKSTLRPGDIRYLDRNGDGVIDANDQGPIGNGLPTVYFGITAGVNYKGFDLSILFQGTGNRQLYLSGDFWNGFGNGGTYNAYDYNLNRWTPATAKTATSPRVGLGTNTNNTVTSSYWMKNADFIRLKNAEVGYTLPAQLTRKIGVPVIRVYANGLNLLTWSELFKLRKDVDPETLGSSYPLMRVINFGINAKF